LSVLSSSEEMLSDHLEKITTACSLLEMEKDPKKRGQLGKELRDLLFKTRSFSKSVGSSARRAGNLAEIIRLSEVSPEAISNNPHIFKPYEEIKEIIVSSEHTLIRNGLGLRFYYPQTFRDLTFRTNQGAFNSIFGNVVDNAMQYAVTGSVILSRVSTDGETFYFEIENLIAKPINDKELEYLFKKGYRREKLKPGERNEGFGLYFVNRAVKRGYEGRIEAHGQGNFRITQERTQELKKDEYGIKRPESYEPLTPFHARISIPLERLLKKERPKINDPDEDLGISAFI